MIARDGRALTAEGFFSQAQPSHCKPTKETAEASEQESQPNGRKKERLKVSLLQEEPVLLHSHLQSHLLCCKKLMCDMC